MRSLAESCTLSACSASALLALALLAAAPSSAAATDSFRHRPSTGHDVVRFVSPSRTVSCEIHWNGPDAASFVRCQTFLPPRLAILQSDGALSITTVPPTRLAKRALRARPVLAYGATRTVGRFRCTSRESGITCRVASHGFRIAPSGIVGFAPPPQSVPLVPLASS